MRTLSQFETVNKFVLVKKLFRPNDQFRSIQLVHNIFTDFRETWFHKRLTNRGKARGHSDIIKRMYLPLACSVAKLHRIAKK